MIPYVIAALIWVFCLVIEFILNRVEKRLDYYHDYRAGRVALPRGAAICARMN